MQNSSPLLSAAGAAASASGPHQSGCLNDEISSSSFNTCQKEVEVYKEKQVETRMASAQAFRNQYPIPSRRQALVGAVTGLVAFTAVTVSYLWYTSEGSDGKK